MPEGVVPKGPTLTARPALSTLMLRRDLEIRAAQGLGHTAHAATDRVRRSPPSGDGIATTAAAGTAGGHAIFNMRHRGPHHPGNQVGPATLPEAA